MALTELEFHCLLHEAQKEAEGTSQSRRYPPSRTDFVSIYSTRKHPGCFEIDNWQQRNLKNLDYCHFVTLHRGGLNASKRKVD